MKISYSRYFKKQLRKLPLKHKQQLGRRLNIFIADPRHPMLNIHTLKGKYSQCLSMNISGDIRLIFQYQNNKSEILLLTIGTHSQLY